MKNLGCKHIVYIRKGLVMHFWSISRDRTVQSNVNMSNMIFIQLDLRFYICDHNNQALLNIQPLFLKL